MVVAVKQSDKGSEHQRKASKGVTVEEYLGQAVTAIRQMVEAESNSCPQRKWPYVCVEDFVLHHGRAFIRTRSLPKGIPRGDIKECYKNAFLLMMSNPNLTYVEGHACFQKSLLMMHQHAWCVDETGDVIDPTWMKGLNHFGVPFTRAFVLATYEAIGRAGVIENEEQGYPLLSKKLSGFREERFFRQEIAASTRLSGSTAARRAASRRT